jgi:hypothetical protein
MSDPIIEFNGIQVRAERPAGYIQAPTPEKPTHARIYGWDRRTGERVPGFITYGSIVGTRGADGDELDVYLGADLRADTAYLIEQTGNDPEYKLVVGWPTENEARSVFAAHTPAELIGEVHAIPIALVQQLLGVDRLLDKAAPEKRLGAALLKAADSAFAKAAAPAGMKVQSLIFDAAKFAAAQAREWADAHEFSSAKVDETEQSFRLRQIDPDEFDSSTFRTIRLRPGVSAVVGKLRAATKTEKAAPVLVCKEDDAQELRYVLGVVLEPLDPAAGEADLQGDAYSEEEIRKAMWSFMKDRQTMLVLHSRQGGRVMQDIDVVESYQVPADVVINGHAVRKGTWLLGVHVRNDAAWSAVKAGELAAFSIEGVGERVPVDAAGAVATTD